MSKIILTIQLHDIYLSMTGLKHIHSALTLLLLTSLTLAATLPLQKTPFHMDTGHLTLFRPLTGT